MSTRPFESIVDKCKNENINEYIEEFLFPKGPRISHDFSHSISIHVITISNSQKKCCRWTNLMLTNKIVGCYFILCKNVYAYQ